jgi:peptidoglycan/xylan/chitin deacetylase (PgdA/CDA1 family)
MGAALKRLAEAALLYGGPAGLSRRRLGPRTLILAYHNILPDDARPGRDRSLHLSRREFAEQLDVIREHCEVIPLGQALARGNRDRPRIAITFDDAYHGAVSAGAAELVRRDLPATFFVAPGFLGGRSFWWDAIAVPGNSTLPDAARSHALDTCAGRDDQVREWARLQGWSMEEPDSASRCSTEQDLLIALDHPGITVGSHTWSHPNLARLAGTELEMELRRPLEWLRERFVRVLDWLSYPYGLATPNVETAVKHAGYAAAVLVSGGWMPEHTDNPYAIPRFNVPAGISLDGFRLRLAGLLCR